MAMEEKTAERRCVEMMKRMFSLTKNESLRDLVLSVGEETFRVHKFVLAAASFKLYEMILKDTKAGEDGIPTLVLENVTPKGIQLLLHYVYKGSVPEFANEAERKEFAGTCGELDVYVPELPLIPEPTPAPKTSVAKEAETKQSKSNIIAENVDKQPEICVEVTTNAMNSTKSVNENLSQLASVMRVRTEPIVLLDKIDHVNTTNDKKQIEFPDLAAVELEEVGEDTSTVVVQIVEDEMEANESDIEYEADVKVEFEVVDDFDAQGVTRKKKLQGKENSKSPSPRKKPRIKQEPIIVQGVDISALFSTQIRDSPVKPTVKRLPPPKPDPSLALKRGRPRLANDYLFSNDPPYICPHENCTKECDTREKLKKHYRSHGERTRACGLCEKKFFYKKDLICHLRTHTGERPFKCDACGQGFAQKATLQYHMQMHNDTRVEYRCEECGQTYKTFKGLKTHIERHHADSEKTVFTPDLALLENPVSCPVCSRRFRNYQSHNMHLKRQHPGSEEAKGLLKGRQHRKPQATVKERTPQEVVVLQECPVESQNIATVQSTDSVPQEHVVVDSTPTSVGFSIVCATCGRKFKKEETYAKHYEKCKGVAQYQCDFCEHSFKSKKLKKKHIEQEHRPVEKSSPEPAEVVVTSIDGIVSPENIESVSVLNLQNIF